MSVEFRIRNVTVDQKKINKPRISVGTKLSSAIESNKIMLSNIPADIPRNGWCSNARYASEYVAWQDIQLATADLIDAIKLINSYRL